MAATLYITRNGLLEPLGQSQVFAYLRGLSLNYSITLITYEKPEDWNDSSRIEHARSACDQYGIRWLPQVFRARPRGIAAALNMVGMFWLVWREVRAGNADLIHARSYIPAAVALLVLCVTRVPFIFDMRALWPEELITAGRLRRGSLLHRAIVRIERSCLRHAAAVVSLTQAAKEYLLHEYPVELEDQTIKVIPTCADLERFTPPLAKATGPTVHGCIGTVLSGWFRTDWLALWWDMIAARDPKACFEVVTRDNAELVRSEIDPRGKLGPRLKIGPNPSEDMPDAIRGHDLSVMFFTGGLSKLGSTPTRMAEVLASGLPVVVNEGVGDVAEIVRDNKVGVVVVGATPRHMETAYQDLQDLMADSDLSARCRATAEQFFSLGAGTAAYREIYRSVLNLEGTRHAPK